MTNIYTLTSRNFQVIEGQTKNSLCVNVPNQILVFYKTSGCTYCKLLEPIVRQLANEDKRITYGIVDFTNDKAIVKMSRETTTVIETVPQLILYSDGKPYAKFTGEKNLNSLKSFLTTTLNTIAQKVNQQQFVPQQQFPQNMYGGQQQSNSSFGPDAQSPPSQAARIAQGNQIARTVHASMQNQCDPEKESCIHLPKGITPKNQPWQIDIIRFSEYGEI
jgi:thiol-disulfide isomerase/thioredoxin